MQRRQWVYDSTESHLDAHVYAIRDRAFAHRERALPLV